MVIPMNNKYSSARRLAESQRYYFWNDSSSKTIYKRLVKYIQSWAASGASLLFWFCDSDEVRIHQNGIMKYPWPAKTSPTNNQAKNHKFHLPLTPFRNNCFFFFFSFFAMTRTNIERNFIVLPWMLKMRYDINISEDILWMPLSKKGIKAFFFFQAVEGNRLFLFISINIYLECTFEQKMTSNKWRQENCRITK